MVDIAGRETLQYHFKKKTGLPFSPKRKKWRCSWKYLNDLVDIAGTDTFSISTFPSSSNSRVSKILSTRAKSSRLSSSSLDLLLSVPLVLDEIVYGSKWDFRLFFFLKKNKQTFYLVNTKLQERKKLRRHTHRKKRSLRNTFESSPSYDALLVLECMEILF